MYVFETCCILLETHGKVLFLNWLTWFDFSENPVLTRFSSQILICEENPTRPECARCRGATTEDEYSGLAACPSTYSSPPHFPTVPANKQMYPSLCLHDWLQTFPFAPRQLRALQPREPSHDIPCWPQYKVSKNIDPFCSNF